MFGLSPKEFELLRHCADPKQFETLPVFLFNNNNNNRKTLSLSHF